MVWVPLSFCVHHHWGKLYLRREIPIFVVSKASKLNLFILCPPLLEDPGYLLRTCSIATSFLQRAGHRLSNPHRKENRTKQVTQFASITHEFACFEQSVKRAALFGGYPDPGGCCPCLGGDREGDGDGDGHRDVPVTRRVRLVAVRHLPTVLSFLTGHQEHGTGSSEICRT